MKKSNESLSEIKLVGITASTQDLDSALMFLARNEHSAYMTGTNITVDGGQSCGVTSW